jgi:hypothetical protein
MVMQMEIRTIKSGLALALTMVSLSCLFAQPAHAVMRDQALVGRLQDQRNVLIIEERQLWQDYDDLQRKIKDFQRNGDQRLVDQLCRDADRKFEDLQTVRFNLRQIDTLLM